MTVYVVPCGVSVFDGIARRRTGVADADADWLADEARQWGERTLDERSGPHAFVGWQHVHARHAGDAMIGQWSPLVSAETSTLAARTSEFDRLLTGGHTVQLLASDTANGLGAAMLVGSRICRGELDRLRYTTTRSADLRPAAGNVVVVRVVGLDPRVQGGFHIACAGIGHALRAALDATGEQSLEVHLTAGFKATLLHTLAMTEVLHGRAPDRVSAWYLSDEDPQRTPVRIGLRRFPVAQLDGMHDELLAVQRGRPPTSEHFLGVAWDETAGRRVLNDFGTGFLAVLGESAQPPGDDAGVVGP